jgi:hypothetical protein
MSYASRDVFYVPTVWPHERQKARKRPEQMKEEGIAPTSTDIWNKNPMQRYKDRPQAMRDVCLTDPLAWYTTARRTKKVTDDDMDDAIMSDEESKKPKNVVQYKKRTLSRVLRSRSYGVEDVNYKRELVLLYVPFRNEAADVLDRNRFLELYEKHESAITEKRKLYENNIDIAQFMDELKQLCALNDECAEEPDDGGSSLLREQQHANEDDIFEASEYGGISVFGKRDDVMHIRSSAR